MIGIANVARFNIDVNTSMLQVVFPNACFSKNRRLNLFKDCGLFFQQFLIPSLLTFSIESKI
jgi:hypothetical protein